MKENISALLKLLRTADENAARARSKIIGCEIYELDASSLGEAAAALHSAGGFDTLETIVASDCGALNEAGYLLAQDEARPRQHRVTTPHIELTYIFSSSSGGARAALRSILQKREGRIPSLCGIYPAAELPEREIAELFGLVFSGADAARFITDEGARGSPLLRGYEHEPDLMDGQ